MKSTEHLEAKILKYYNKADTETLLTGMTWYNRAHNEALLLSQVFEIPLIKVCGVIAALSPRNKWGRNLADAWNIIENPSLQTKTCTFKGQRQKAIDIINSTGDENEILRLLGKGEKTRNFFTNIFRYKTSQSVTVDVWAYRSVNLEAKNKYYKPVATAYTNVANQLNIMPHQLQAVVWGVVRGSLV